MQWRGCACEVSSHAVQACLGAPVRTAGVFDDELVQAQLCDFHLLDSCVLKLHSGLIVDSVLESGEYGRRGYTGRTYEEDEPKLVVILLVECMHLRRDIFVHGRCRRRLFFGFPFLYMFLLSYTRVCFERF